jgi:hypothetical protein
MTRRTTTQYGRRDSFRTIGGVTRGEIRTGFRAMLGRALLRRCPRCGGAGWFTGWFAKGERCRAVVDLAMRPVEPDEVADADRHRGALSRPGLDI